MAPIGAESRPLTPEEAAQPGAGETRQMSPAPPQRPTVLAALERFRLAALSPCRYDNLGLNCLRFSASTDSWADMLQQMRTRTTETVPHAPCLPCEARLQLSSGPWGPDQTAWNGRAR